MRYSPSQYAFSSGEIAPLLWGRPDYQRYQSGLRLCRGFLPLRQGGITRGPGTLFRGETKAGAAGRLIPFQFAVNDSVVLEFTDGVMRVWRYGVLVESAPSTPYELATPYDLDAIARLQFVQSADAIYLVDGVLPMQRLARLALDNWTIGAAAVRNGPFKVQNLDEAITLQASAASGSITITGVGTSFDAGWVGSLLHLKATDDIGVPYWTGNTTVSPGDQMRYDGRIYEVVSGTDTGVNPPIHTEGDILSEAGKVLWRHITDGSGIAEITAVAGATSITATVLKTIPPGCVSAPTYRWAESAWSDRNGYPATISIYDRRLACANTPGEPRTIWFSTLGDYLDFEPTTSIDGSFAYAIAGSESQNEIVWLRQGARGLHVGALGEEYSTRSTNNGEAISVLNIAFQRDTKVGSRRTTPVAPDGKPMFISADGTRLFEISYAFQDDKNKAEELSLPSDHIGALGFEQIVWQSVPTRIGWLRLTSGDLAAMIYDPREEVLGWMLHPIGGNVISLAVSRNAAGTEDIVNCIVERTVDGVLKRYVEDLVMNYDILRGSVGIEHSVHLFSSMIFNPGSPTDTFTGLGHLEGETVSVWTDKGELGPVEVTGGQVTLLGEVNRATIGKFNEDHVASTLDIGAQAQDGSALGRTKRTKAIGVKLHNTAAAELRYVERRFGQADINGAWRDITNQSVPTDLIAAYSGVVMAQLPSGMATEVYYEMRPLGGAPMTVLAIAPMIDVAGG